MHELSDRSTLVLYDADCGICSRTARLLTRVDRGRRLKVVPAQAGGDIPGAPPLEARLAAVHVRDPEGGWISGGAAVLGIPLTALGFVLAADAINAVGATIVGLSGIGVGFALLTARTDVPSDWLRRVAGGALLIGMPMGIAWSLAILVGQPILDLDTMVRTHGALNSLGVLLAVLLYRPLMKGVIP